MKLICKLCCSLLFINIILFSFTSCDEDEDFFQRIYNSSISVSGEIVSEISVIEGNLPYDALVKAYVDYADADVAFVGSGTIKGYELLTYLATPHYSSLMRLSDEAPESLRISDKNLSVASISYEVYGSRGNYYLGELWRAYYPNSTLLGMAEVNHLYADRKATVKGKEFIQMPVGDMLIDVECRYDMLLLKGWNSVSTEIVSITNDRMIMEIKANEEPLSTRWYYIEDAGNAKSLGQEVVSRFKPFNYLGVKSKREGLSQVSSFPNVNSIN